MHGPSSQANRGFSLVELLVSCAVLSILLLIFLKMVDLTSNTWRSGSQRAEILTEARAVLGLIDRDLQSMVFRRDLPAFTGQTGELLKDEGGNPVYFFYSMFQAPEGNRKLSLVQYRLDKGNHQLVRSDLGFGYPGGADTPKFHAVTQLSDLGTAVPQALAEGVVDFQWQFQDGNGVISVPNDLSPFSFDHSRPDAPSNSRAVIVSLLSLNSEAMARVREHPEVLGELKEELSQPQPGETWADGWTKDLDSPRFGANLPKQVRSGIHVHQRRFILPHATVR